MRIGGIICISGLNDGIDLDSMYLQTDRKLVNTYFSVLIFAFVLAIIITGIANAVQSIQQVGLDLRQDRDEGVEVFGNLYLQKHYCKHVVNKRTL